MPDNNLKLIFDITNENEGSPIVGVTRQKGKGLLGLSLRLTKSPSSVKKEGDDYGTGRRYEGGDLRQNDMGGC